MGNETLTLFEKLQQLVKQKRSISWYANKLSITEGEVERLLEQMRESTTAQATEYDCEVEENFEKGTKKSTVICDSAPKTTEELYELHKIDKSLYKISSYWSKQRGDKFACSVLASQIKPTDFDAVKFGEFFKNYKAPSLERESKKRDWTRDMVDIEISLTDFHIDKLTIDGESIEDKIANYKKILTSLVDKASRIYDVRTIVFPISNDFFHTDNIQNQTTSGTQLEVNTSWNTAYEKGFELMVWAINYLRGSCISLEVILVQGNHDRTKGYYMAHALSVYFSSCQDINFDRDFDSTKFITVGNTFIGYHHGNCKLEDLPLIFATNEDSSSDFGNAKYREVHTGDKHYYLVKEVKGVRIQQLPSLSSLDRWHKDMNFVNSLRAGLALIYDPVKGKIGELEERL